MTRTQASHPYALASAQGRRYWDFFSLAGGKVRVAYPSNVLLRTLPSGERSAIRGRVILALTANPYYSLHGVRPGMNLSTAAKRLHTGAAIQVGLDDWFMATGSPTVVLKVRNGTVEELGIARSDLTQNRKAQSAFIRSFS
jgi:hypothetical protein